MNETIRRIVAVHGKLHVPMDHLGDSDDLFRAGMTSLTTVSVMLAIEDSLDVEFPQELIQRATFQSIKTLAAATTEMQVRTA